MALHVVPDACSFTPDRARGVIVIESDVEGPNFGQAFYELGETSCRHMAQSYAARQGVAPAYLNDNVIGPYPVNSEGLSLEHVKDQQGQPLPQQHPRMQPRRYRVDVAVTRPLR